MSTELERDPLALAMFAAWVRVKPDAVPPTMRAQTGAHTREAWARVGEAATEHVHAEMLPDEDQLVQWLAEARARWTAGDQATPELVAQHAELPSVRQTARYLAEALRR